MITSLLLEVYLIDMKSSASEKMVALVSDSLPKLRLATICNCSIASSMIFLSTERSPFDVVSSR